MHLSATVIGRRNSNRNYLNTIFFTLNWHYGISADGFQISHLRKAAIVVGNPSAAVKMKETSPTVTLYLHDCYAPIIKIFWWKPHEDINGVTYYRALYTSPTNTKHGFIVRNEFVENWTAFLIAELNLILTNQGATLINYETFDSLKDQHQIEFVEIRGVFVIGKHEIQLPETGQTHLIYFVPSLPNRFSFNATRSNYFGDNANNFKTVHVKHYTRNDLKLVTYNVFFVEEKEYKENPQTFIILHRTKTEFETDGNEYGSWVTGDYRISNSIVFSGGEKLNGHFVLPEEKYKGIEEFITTREKELFSEYDYLLALRNLLRKVLSLSFKLEFTLPKAFVIEDQDTKEQLHKIEGHPYYPNDLALGLERNVAYKEDYAEYLDLENVTIAINVILQV